MNGSPNFIFYSRQQRGTTPSTQTILSPHPPSQPVIPPQGPDKETTPEAGNRTTPPTRAAGRQHPTDDRTGVLEGGKEG